MFHFRFDIDRLQTIYYKTMIYCPLPLSAQVFFRAGVLGRLEDMRDQRLAIVLTQFQSFCRGHLMRKQYKKLLDQR